MHSERMAFQHYRIHVMEQWSDGPAKEAGLASARSMLDSIVQNKPEEVSFLCAVCASRRQNVIVMQSAAPVKKLASPRAA